MIEIIGSVFAYIFGDLSWLATVLVAMFPIIEVKGAIPIGVSYEFWGDNALSPLMAGVCGIIGSSLIVPILAAGFRPLIRWLKSSRVFGKFARMYEDKVSNKASKINNGIRANSVLKQSIFKMLGVFAFVSVPLPLTGVWTGTCIGVALGLKTWQTILAVIGGNIVARVLIMTVCVAFPQFTAILLMIVLGIVAMMISVGIIKIFISKTKRNLREDDIL